MKVYLSNSVSERFRRIAMSVYGYGRGSLSKAAEEAFARWCTEHDSSLNSADLGHSESTSNPAEKIESRIDPDERKISQRESKSVAETDDQHKG